MFCSLRYPACNAFEPYCHLCPAPLYNIFPHYLLKGTYSGGGRSLQLLCETFLILIRIVCCILRCLVFIVASCLVYCCSCLACIVVSCLVCIVRCLVFIVASCLVYCCSCLACIVVSCLVCIVVRCLVFIVVSCLVCIVVILCVFVVLCVYCFQDAGLLARSQYSEGPATGPLDTGFSRFPCA